MSTQFETQKNKKTPKRAHRGLVLIKAQETELLGNAFIRGNSFILDIYCVSKVQHAPHDVAMYVKMRNL